MYDSNELLKQYPEIKTIFKNNPILHVNLIRYYRFISTIRFACENAKSMSPLSGSYFTIDQIKVLDSQLFQDEYAAIIFVNDYIRELGRIDAEENKNDDDLDTEYSSNEDKFFMIGLSLLEDCHVADMVLKSQEMLNSAVNRALGIIQEDFIPDDL